MSYRDSGSFFPSTQVWDPTSLLSMNIQPPEFKELMVRMYQNLNLMAIMLNGKETGIYHTDEFVTGQVFPPDANLTSLSSTTPQQRSIYRKIINFGMLPNANHTDIPHGLTITDNFTFTRIYGCASDPVAHSFLPIPYSSVTDVAHNIELEVTNTNVIITTGTDRRPYTRCWVILEYMKIQS